METFDCPHANCTLDFAHTHPPGPPITQPRTPHGTNADVINGNRRPICWEGKDCSDLRCKGDHRDTRDIIAQDNAAEAQDRYGQDVRNITIQQTRAFQSTSRTAYHLTDLQMGLIIRALRIYDEHSPDDYIFKRRLASILEIAMTDSRDS